MVTIYRPTAAIEPIPFNEIAKIKRPIFSNNWFLFFDLFGAVWANEMNIMPFGKYMVGIETNFGNMLNFVN